MRLFCVRFLICIFVIGYFLLINNNDNTDATSNVVKMQVKSLEVTPVPLVKNIVLKPLYKYEKKDNDTYGYSNTPVYLYDGSQQIVSLPETLPDQAEFRAVFLATIDNLNFKKVSSESEFKEEFKKVLDTLDNYNINSLIFQVSPMLDAYYKSKLNPSSQFISGTQGEDLDFDPLKYMVEESHKRSIAYYAWFNPFRVTNKKISSPFIMDKIKPLALDHIVSLSIDEELELYDNKGILAKSNFAVNNPNYVLRFDEKLFLNPAIEEVVQHVADVVSEVINNYDIDGVLFDDYFYPYPINIDGQAKYFGDDGEDLDYFMAYAESTGVTNTAYEIEEWRRDNILNFIKKIKSTVDEYNYANNKFVKFGLSPFGIWEHKQNDDRGSNTNPSSIGTHSKAVYLDSYTVVKEGLIDFIIPQIYWSLDHDKAPYGELVRWWDDLAKGTGVNVYTGNALYKYDQNADIEPAWMNSDEMINQMKFNELYDNIKGYALYGYNDLILKNISDNESLKAQVIREALNKIK